MNLLDSKSMVAMCGGDMSWAQDIVEKLAETAERTGAAEAFANMSWTGKDERTDGKFIPEVHIGVRQTPVS